MLTIILIYKCIDLLLYKCNYIYANIVLIDDMIDTKKGLNVNLTYNFNSDFSNAKLHKDSKFVKLYRQCKEERNSAISRIRLFFSLFPSLLFRFNGVLIVDDVTPRPITWSKMADIIPTTFLSAWYYVSSFLPPTLNCFSFDSAVTASLCTLRGTRKYSDT